MRTTTADPTEALPDFALDPALPLANRFAVLGIGRFRGAASHVHLLPYGRISRPSDLPLVLEEARGTCSTKQGLLAALAREQGRDDVELLVGVFEMTEASVPGVGAALAEHGMASVPEAHCWLRCGGRDADLTFPHGSGLPPRPMLRETTMGPRDLGTEKPALHREAVRAWAAERGIDPGRVWAAREACIAALSAALAGARR